MYTGNSDFKTIAETYGTPLYVYELDRIKDRHQQLIDAVNYKDLGIHYAMKANFNPDILKFMRSLGIGIDAVSPQEILLAKKLGFQNQEIIFTVNNITEKEILETQKQDVLFNLGSLSEVEKYGLLFPNSKICIRFNPDVIAGAHKKIQTAGPSSKFGILLDYLEDLKRIVNKYSLSIVGVHIHTGSGIKDLDQYLKAVDNLISITTPQNFPELEFVDLGGGLFVPYHPEDQEMNLNLFGQELRTRMEDLNKNFNKELKLYLEPGKFLVADAGHFIVQVNTIKINHDLRIVGTDSGFNHLGRPVMYDAYHQIENLSNSNGPLLNYDIVGNICESGDNFASNRPIAEINENDLLIIHTAGAYCFSMASQYNLRILPTEVVVTNNQAKLSRKAESAENFVDELLTKYS